jgi:hypothetical protein
MRAISSSRVRRFVWVAMALAALFSPGFRTAAGQTASSEERPGLPEPAAGGSRWCRVTAGIIPFVRVDDVAIPRPMLRRAGKANGRHAVGLFGVGVARDGRLAVRLVLERPGDAAAMVALGAFLLHHGERRCPLGCRAFWSVAPAIRTLRWRGTAVNLAFGNRDASWSNRPGSPPLLSCRRLTRAR